MICTSKISNVSSFGIHTVQADDGNVLHVSEHVPGGPQLSAAPTTAAKLQDGASTSGACMHSNFDIVCNDHVYVQKGCLKND